jgi:hypothetical protein
MKCIKKFASILGFFIVIPIAVITILYSIACFVAWGILPVHVEWVFIRIYIIVAFVVSFFMSLDNDL